MTAASRATSGGVGGETLLDAFQRGGWRAVIAHAAGLSADERRGLRRDLAGLAAASRESRAAPRAARASVMGKPRRVRSAATRTETVRERMHRLRCLAGSRKIGRILRANPALMEPLRKAHREWYLGRRVRLFEEEAPHAAQVLGPAGVRDAVSRLAPRRRTAIRVRAWIRRHYGA